MLGLAVFTAMSRNVDNSRSRGRRVDLKVEGWSMLRRGMSVVKDVLQETSSMVYI